MRQLSWAMLAAFAAGITYAATGCGSESSDDIAPAGDLDAATDGTTAIPPGPTPPSDGSTNTDAGLADAAADAAACKPGGASCTADTECCSVSGVRSCVAVDGGAKVCAGPSSSCKAAAAACTAGTECCTNACVGNQCSAVQCTADNQACTTNEQCCGGSCVDDGTGAGTKKCAALNPTCKTAGNPCGGDPECCSKLCIGGTCSSAVSFCVQQGDVCADNNDCCGGNCAKASGATLGTCGPTVSAPGAGDCAVKGTVCGKVGDPVPSCGGTCCSRVCATSGAAPGYLVCQPPSGCSPIGELCRFDSDCCGWSGAPPYSSVIGPTNDITCSKSSPTQEFGRCDQGLNCKEAGTICKPSVMEACSAHSDCCRPNGAPNASYCNADPANCCRKDALGIPRCLLNANDCTTNPPKPGDSCATSADCCGKPCIDNKCEAQCVPQNGKCTTHADCCSGLPCVIPTGSSEGICGGTIESDGGVSGTDSGTTDAGTACALYGQTCTQSTDCCDSVPCSGGYCRYN